MELFKYNIITTQENNKLWTKIVNSTVERN